MIASTKFRLTFFLRLPPPTDNIKIPSFLFSLLILSHSENEVFHPSSFILAENSETLSVGVYASISHIFLKSFTAWDAFPALPPTPKKKILPFFFLNLKYFFY